MAGLKPLLIPSSLQPYFQENDLVDLCCLLQEGSLEAIFEVTAVKYARVRSFPISVIQALPHFTGAEVLPMPRMLDRTPWP